MCSKTIGSLSDISFICCHFLILPLSFLLPKPQTCNLRGFATATLCSQYKLFLVLLFQQIVGNGLKLLCKICGIEEILRRVKGSFDRICITESIDSIIDTKNYKIT